MITVQHLISMLAKLPKDTPILTSGLEGIYPAELGNLFPLKVIQSGTDTKLFIDDGISYQAICDVWEPLDQFIYVDRAEMQ